MKFYTDAVEFWLPFTVAWYRWYNGWGEKCRAGKDCDHGDSLPGQNLIIWPAHYKIAVSTLRHLTQITSIIKYKSR